VPHDQKMLSETARKKFSTMGRGFTRYSEAVSLVHAILGVRASPYVFLRAVGFPGSHGPVTTMAGKG